MKLKFAKQNNLLVAAHLKAPCVVSKFLCVNIGSVVGQQPLRLELQKASEAALELT